MNDSFTVELKTDPEGVLKRINEKLAEVAGSLSGTPAAGSFEGQTPFGPVKGTYAISGNLLTITIVEKPAFVTLSLIENKIRTYVARDQPD